MRIAIIGSTDLAETLAHRLGAAGHDVVRVTPPAVEGPVANAEVVVLALPFHRVFGLPPEPFTGKVVIDATDYFPDRDGSIVELEGRLASSELVARHLRSALVVKAFNTSVFLALAATGPLEHDVPPPAVPIAGDDPSAKVIVAQLVTDLGFEPVDVGRLADSWRLQPGSILYALQATAGEVHAALKVP